MPELDVVLVEFPAEEHFAAVAEVGEIEEAAFEVLDLDTHFLESTKLGVELEHIHKQAGHLFAADFRACLLQFLAEFLVDLLHDIEATVSILKHAAEFGKQRPGFLEGEMFSVQVSHGCGATAGLVAEVSRFFGGVLLKSLEGGIPCEGGAFHADGVLHDALQRLQIAQFLAAKRDIAAHHFQE